MSSFPLKLKMTFRSSIPSINYSKWIAKDSSKSLRNTFVESIFQNYKENGLAMADVYDPQLLSLLGLSPYASSQDIKRRYRELAKKYHPDHGGDAEKFIELLGYTKDSKASNGKLLHYSVPFAAFGAAK